MGVCAPISCDCRKLKNKKPTRCQLLFYCTSYRLSMFRALLCSSSGARDYDVDYHIGRFGLGYCMLEVRCGQPGHYSSLTAPKTAVLCFSLQPGHYSSRTAPKTAVLCFSLQPGHYSSLTAPKTAVLCFSLQPGHYSSLTHLTSNVQRTKTETTSVVISIKVASSWWQAQ